MGVQVVVSVLVALQVLVPAALLVARYRTPHLTMPLGWPMHTGCWGSEEPCG